MESGLPVQGMQTSRCSPASIGIYAVCISHGNKGCWEHELRERTPALFLTGFLNPRLHGSAGFFVATATAVCPRFVWWGLLVSTRSTKLTPAVSGRNGDSRLSGRNGDGGLSACCLVGIVSQHPLCTTWWDGALIIIIRKNGIWQC